MGINDWKANLDTYFSYVIISTIPAGDIKIEFKESAPRAPLGTNSSCSWFFSSNSSGT